MSENWRYIDYVTYQFSDTKQISYRCWFFKSGASNYDNAFWFLSTSKRNFHFRFSKIFLVTEFSSRKKSIYHLCSETVIFELVKRWLYYFHYKKEKVVWSLIFTIMSSQRKNPSEVGYLVTSIPLFCLPVLTSSPAHVTAYTNGLINAPFQHVCFKLFPFPLKLIYFCLRWLYFNRKYVTHVVLVE